ncbi:TetR family transcriptional regulator [Duganella sp. SAP-35]|uniref:TetR family transcriptional regulator n=1 Tax=Duganella aceris TaxID=2703883 RepID=A0ABX0FKT8_9BURK|nr:TetR family transcriptional regulator [Duganella aceris]NGZ85197.1 TetR family transcriptional regulator [Duganella aceris]
MRKSKADAAETRQTIVNVAAEEFRLNGISATGLIALMSKAGLTHGGFYKHFESKDQLVAEACSSAIDGLVARFKEDSAAGGRQGFMSIVDSYLSMEHRDDRAGGCPLAGMGSELVRADDRARAAAAQGFDDLVAVMAGSLAQEGTAHARSDAGFAMAAMVGAMTMSRLMSDPADAAELLDDVRRRLSLI